MQTEPRLQDDPGLASRYLAGQLSPDELQAYERHLLENPEAVREVEATARMKVGLASLRDTGQIEGLLRVQPALSSRWSALAAAAAVIVLALGLWRGMEGTHDAALVATASELTDRDGRPLTAGVSYALLRTRSSAYDAKIALPREPHAIELRVRPQTPARVYSIALSALHPNGSVREIGSVSDLQAQPDGFVRLYVDSSRLEPGPYRVVITPGNNRDAASAFRINATAAQAPD